MTQNGTFGEFNYVGEMSEPAIHHTEAPDKSNINWDARTLPVEDIREAQHAPTLEREGYAVLDVSADVGSGFEAPALAATYQYPILQALRELTGAEKIILPAPTVRSSAKAARRENLNEGRSVARYVHADFDKDRWESTMRAAVAEDPDRDRWMSGRYALIHTWQALSPGPQDTPLAVIDRTTLQPQDYVDVTVEVYGAQYSALGLRYEPRHRWSYISSMTPSDTLVFLGWDSADTSMAGTAHSAFENLSLGEASIPRISSELRAMVYWG